VDAVVDDDADAAVDDPGWLSEEIASDSSVVLLCDDMTQSMVEPVDSDAALRLYSVAALGQIQMGRRWKAVVVTMNKHPLDMRF